MTIHENWFRFRLVIAANISEIFKIPSLFGYLLDLIVNATNKVLSKPKLPHPVTIISINDWIIIQRNLLDGSTTFRQDWPKYKDGFGSPTTTHFWFGNDNLNTLTSFANWRLRVEVQANATGKWYSAEYDAFFISPESSGFVLTVSGYTGDAGDSITNSTTTAAWISNGMEFTARDRGNDLASINCAKTTFSGGGWWMNNCSASSLNGVFPTYSLWEGLQSQGLSSSYYVSDSRMMIKLA